MRGRIEVPASVLAGIEMLRSRAGGAKLGSEEAASRLLEIGQREAAEWARANPVAFAEGWSRGFSAEGESEE